MSIPNSVTTIGDYAFSFCTNLSSATIPNSVTHIGIYAFANCFGITSLTIPNSVTAISENAFAYCTGLTFLTIPNSVISISYSAFSGCKKLTSLVIPNSVTTIGSNAFNDCDGLTSVTIGNGVTFIGDFAFGYTWGDSKVLTDVYCYAEKVPEIGEDPFMDRPIGEATLHVPAGSIEVYKAMWPWKNFKEIVAIGHIEEDETNHNTALRLVIWQKDGSKVSYNLDEQPKTTFTTEELVITTATTTIKYPLAKIQRYTYEGGSLSVHDVKADGISISHEGDNIIVKGLTEGKSVRVYSIDGKQLLSKRSDGSDRLSLSLARFYTGVYLIKADKITYKFLKR